jgi:hypothetical protein
MLVRFLFVSCPGPKAPATRSEHQPVKFYSPPPGQPRQAILQKVTPFNQPTGELIKDVAGIKQPMLTDCQQLIVFHVLTRYMGLGMHLLHLRFRRNRCAPAGPFDYIALSRIKEV